MKNDTLHDLLGYEVWANQLYIDAATKLPEDELRRERGTSHGSFFGTLVHILGAWEVWLARWRGEPDVSLPETTELPDLASVRVRLESATTAATRLLGSLTASELDEPREIRNLRGDAHVHTLRQMFHHVVNHSTYHRGQLAALLRQAGEKPPTTDLIHYYRTRGS